MTTFSAIAPTTRLALAPGSVSADHRDTLVVMNIGAGKYFGFDDIGAQVWNILKTPTAFGDVVARLSEEYETDPARIESDLTPFIGKLLADGLIVAE